MHYKNNYIPYITSLHLETKKTTTMMSLLPCQKIYFLAKDLWTVTPFHMVLGALWSY